MEMKIMTKLERRMTKEDKRAFTLIELLVVIAIIAVLLGLVFPVFQGVLERAKKVQAKNDLTQIVTAVNAFYTEYGKYPTSLTPDTAATWGPANPANTNNLLFNELRACTTTDTSCTAAALLNTRQIVYISPADVKNPAQPKSGIGIPGTGAPPPVGQFWDPWGTPYNVRIDGDYNKRVAEVALRPPGLRRPSELGTPPIARGRESRTAPAAEQGRPLAHWHSRLRWARQVVFPAAPLRTVREVLPHTALHRTFA